MKATFLQRFLAYIIDVMLLSIILSIISSASINSSNYSKLLEEQENLISKYSKQEITIAEYQSQAKKLDYEIAKSSYPSTIIGLVMSIAYFIIFQFLNGGQTIGKKLMKIRIRKQDDGVLKIQDIIIRTLIINSIITTIVTLIAVLTVNSGSYYIIRTVISTAETLFVLVSSFMILYRKDKLGLQDLMTHTEVVKEGNW